MATVIRLQRGGRKKRPFYSVVVMDKRNRRDGAFIEKIGFYDPCREPDVIELNLERVNAWISEGAQISPRVSSLIKLVENPDLVEKTKAKTEEKAAVKQAAVEAKARAEADAAAKAEKEAKQAEEEAARAIATAEETPVEEASPVETKESGPVEEKKTAGEKDEEKADA